MATALVPDSSTSNTDTKEETTGMTGEIDPHFIQYMRIALAVAIVRTKPTGQSAQHYTQQLCIQHRKAQLAWKTQAEKLKNEVLILKQQVQQNNSNEIKKGKGDDEVSGDDSQVYPTPPCSSEDPLRETAQAPIPQNQAPTPQNQAPTPQNQDRFQNIINMTRDATGSQTSDKAQSMSAQRLRQPFPVPNFPTDAVKNTTQTPDSSQAQSMFALAQNTPDCPPQHAAFLQCVLKLSEITMNDTDSQSVTINPVFEQSALASIECALISLGDILTHPVPASPIISQKMLLHMSQVLINLVDNNNRFSHYFTEKVCDKTLCFTWGIIMALSSNKDLTDTCCERLTELLLLLCRSPNLRPAILRMLSSQLVQVASHMRQLPDHHLRTDTAIFNTSYHLLRSLERILEMDILRQDKCLSVELCRQLQVELDSCLVHVWERFLPFAQYVWHVEGLIHCLHPTLADNRDHLFT